MKFLNIAGGNGRSLLFSSKPLGSYAYVVLANRDIKHGRNSLFIGASGELERRAAALDYNLGVLHRPVLWVVDDRLHRAKDRRIQRHRCTNHCSYRDSNKSPEHRILLIQSPRRKLCAESSARKWREDQFNTDIYSSNSGDWRTAISVGRKTAGNEDDALDFNLSL